MLCMTRLSTKHINPDIFTGDQGIGIKSPLYMYIIVVSSSGHEIDSNYCAMGSDQEADHKHRLSHDY